MLVLHVSREKGNIIEYLNSTPAVSVRSISIRFLRRLATAFLSRITAVDLISTTIQALGGHHAQLRCSDSVDCRSVNSLRSGSHGSLNTFPLQRPTLYQVWERLLGNLSIHLLSRIRSHPRASDQQQ